MKIAFITPGFSADESDWCIPVLLNLVREMAREHEIHVFTLRYPHRQSRYSVHGAAVHAFGGAARAGMSRFPLLAHALTAMRAEARRRPFDVVHGFWADEPGFLAALAGRVLRIPAIVSLMGGELVGFPELGYGGQLSTINWILTRLAIRSSTKITVGSHYFGAIARPSIPDEKLHELPLGVDAQHFHPHAQPTSLFPADKVNLLHVASLVPIKDQATLLHAFALSSHEFPEIHLYLAGEGPLRPTLEQLANDLEISSRITFHGSVSHDHLPDYYRAADLCVLSSRFESQGMVVLEAAACGVTTVGTAVGILPELVPAELLAPVGAAESLARAISRLAGDSARRKEAGREIYARVRGEFSLEKTVARLLDLYQSRYV